MSGCVLQAFPDLNFMRNHFTDVEMGAVRLSTEGYTDTVSEPRLSVPVGLQSSGFYSPHFRFSSKFL